MQKPKLLSSIFLVFCASCTSVVRIPKSELKHLNGYDIHKEFPVSLVGVNTEVNGRTVPVAGNRMVSHHRVIADDGEAITWTSEKKLILYPTNNGEPIEGRYRAIEVDATTFRGTPLEHPTADVEMPLDQVSHAAVKQLSLSKTVALSLVGAFAFIGGFIAYYAVEFNDSGN